MARIRSVKPEFWTDEKVVELSFQARLLFIGLWNFADDEGRMVYSPKRIKMQVFPADSVDVSELVGEIQRNGMVQVYVVDGVEYLQINNFAKHQKIDKRSASKFPVPPTSAESPRIPPNPAESATNPADFRRIPPTDQGRDQGMEGIKEGKGKDKPASAARLRSMPSGFVISDRVRKWASEKGYDNLEAHFEEFMSYVQRKQPKYADWDEALMLCIRKDWAGLRKGAAIPDYSAVIANLKD